MASYSLNPQRALVVAAMILVVIEHLDDDSADAADESGQASTSTGAYLLGLIR